MISYIFKQPRDINGTYNFTYNVIDIESYYFPKGFNANGTMFYATTNDGGFALDGTTARTIPATALAGALLARVLFLLEFIGYP